MIAALVALTCAAGTPLYDDGTARIFRAANEVYARGETPHALYPDYRRALYSSFTRVGARVAFVESFPTGVGNFRAHAVIAADDAGTSLSLLTAPGEAMQAVGFDAAGGMAVLEGAADTQDVRYVGADGREGFVAPATDALPSSFAVTGETASWTTRAGAPGSALLPVFGCADGTTIYDDGAGTRLFDTANDFLACTPSVRTPRRLFKYFPHSLGDTFRVLGRSGDRLLVADDWVVQFSQGTDAGWLDLRSAGLHVSGLGFVLGGVKAMAAQADGDVAVLEAA